MSNQFSHNYYIISSQIGKIYFLKYLAFDDNRSNFLLYICLWIAEAFRPLEFTLFI